MQQVTKVALIGMGTVGTGVARLLIDHGDRTVGVERKLYR